MAAQSGALMRRRTEQQFLILQSIHRHSTRSRAEIAEELKIPPATVSALLRGLLEQGTLVEEGFEPSTGGRRRARLAIAPDAATVIAVHVGMRRLRGVLTDLRGRIKLERAHSGQSPVSVKDTLTAICEIVNDLARKISGRRLLGVGIGISGVIREGGRVRREFPHCERWADVPLADVVRESCGVTPMLVNDVQAAALAELKFGGHGAVRDLVLLHVGDGIAAGIIADGRLYRGASLNAGEIGHNIVREDGPLCYCGNRGCLESLAAPEALLRACREAIERGVHTEALDLAGSVDRLTFEHLLAAGGRGDRLSGNLIREAGDQLGQAAALLVNVFDPQLLLLGGALAGAGNVLAETVERVARTRVLPVLREGVRIESSRLGEAAPLLGTSAWVLDAVFNDPERLRALRLIGDGS